MKNYYWSLDRKRFFSHADEWKHNGRFEIKYGMPCFWCCRRRASIGWINAELPAEYREYDEFLNSKNMEVTFERFIELRKLLLEHPNFSGFEEDHLERGYWMFPGEFSPPELSSDFSWSVMPGLIVSKRIFDVLYDHASEDFSFREMEGGYRFIFVTNYGKPPIEKRVDGIEICNRCGSSVGGYNKSRYIFEGDMWPGSSIFYIEGSAHLFITNELKEKLELLKPVNIIFRRVDVGSSYNASYLKNGIMI